MSASKVKTSKKRKPESDIDDDRSEKKQKVSESEAKEPVKTLCELLRPFRNKGSTWKECARRAKGMKQRNVAAVCRGILMVVPQDVANKYQPQMLKICKNVYSKAPEVFGEIWQALHNLVTIHMTKDLDETEIYWVRAALDVYSAKIDV